jgi:hypothetical protein
MTSRIAIGPRSSCSRSRNGRVRSWCPARRAAPCRPTAASSWSAPGGGFQLYDVKRRRGTPEPVSTSGLQMDLDPVAEWRQIFDESWRLFRDYFYVENMHGYDWDALGERSTAPNSPRRPPVGPQLRALRDGVRAQRRPHLHRRRRLRDPRSPSGRPAWRPVRARRSRPVAIGSRRSSRPQRGGEVPLAPHRGRRRRPPKATTCWPSTAASSRRSTTRTGCSSTPTDPVTLTLNDSRISTARARSPTCRCARERAGLPRLGAGQRRAGLRDDRRPGRLPPHSRHGVGRDRRVHQVVLPADPQRGPGGRRPLQRRRQRLGHDHRAARHAVSWAPASAASELPSTYPSTAFHGHMACLISETSASDGDIFPHYFREAGLGPLIGKKTWGGVVGGGYIPLIDGGSLFVPRSATNDADGEYIIEGIGVAPDIEVANDPASVLAGRDPQLERGVEEIGRHRAGSQVAARASRRSGEDAGAVIPSAGGGEPRPRSSDLAQRDRCSNGRRVAFGAHGCGAWRPPVALRPDASLDSFSGAWHPPRALRRIRVSGSGSISDSKQRRAPVRPPAIRARTRSPDTGSATDRTATEHDDPQRQGLRQALRQVSRPSESPPVLGNDVAAPWRPPWYSRRMTNITWISIVKGK